MPELPDIQVLKELVDATSLHRPIEDVMLREEMVEEVSPQKIRDRLRGAALAGTDRHGKHLFLRAGDRGWLRLHFGMAGYLAAYSEGEEPEHTQLRIDFSDGSHLAYVCVRKLGGISWVEHVDEFIDEHDLGPDALQDLGRERFHRLIAERRGGVKAGLMSQSVIAGLGNVYVDEILFQAGVHPERETASLDQESVDRLFEAMHEVMEGAIHARANPEDMPDDWLLPHREEGASCPRDEGTLEKMEVSGRPTFVCAQHQQQAE